MLIFSISMQVHVGSEQDQDLGTQCGNETGAIRNMSSSEKYILEHTHDGPVHQQLINFTHHLGRFEQPPVSHSESGRAKHRAKRTAFGASCVAAGCTAERLRC